MSRPVRGNECQMMTPEARSSRTVLSPFAFQSNVDSTVALARTGVVTMHPQRTEMTVPQLRRHQPLT